MAGTAHQFEPIGPRTLIELRELVERSWSLDTTYCVETYAGADPAHGQCAVTAVLLQATFGGELVRGRAVGDRFEVWHYWNRLGGLDIDLTWRQFAVGTVLRDVEVTTREVLIANGWMEQRYENLRLGAGLVCDRRFAHDPAPVGVRARSVRSHEE